MNIVSNRLLNQKLLKSSFDKPEQVVGWFGGMQAQNFSAVKWAISLRCQNLPESEIEKAFCDGKILRSHVMRPTWHFVSPKDISWLMDLTSKRVQKFNGSYFRRSGYEREIFKKSNKVLEKALARGRTLTRKQIRKTLEDAGIPLNALGLSFVMMQAELEKVVISGPTMGKQQSYMLFSQRVKNFKKLSTEEALVEIVKRFFQSHGPAQITDFVWWSGLTVSDARRGIEAHGDKLKKFQNENKTYYFFDDSDVKNFQQTACLIPAFDEYFVAYRDRSDILKQDYAKNLNMGGGMINGSVIAGGAMVGTWKRKLLKNKTEVTVKLFEKISSTQSEYLYNCAENFGKFLNLPVDLQISQTG
jgi:hypothetical protein